MVNVSDSDDIRGNHLCNPLKQHCLMNLSNGAIIIKNAGGAFGLNAKTKNFIYQFNNDQNRYPDYPNLRSIGWLLKTQDTPNEFDCRNMQEEACIFIYTLSGEGRVEYNGTTRKLSPGEAFLAEQPGPCRYWLPKSSSHWEYKYLEIGKSSIHYWQRIIDHYGRIIHIPPDSQVIRQLNKLFVFTSMKKEQNFIMNSMHTYAFIMHLHQYLQEEKMKDTNQHALQDCLHIIHTRYHEPLSQAILSKMTGVNESHLFKLFKAEMNISPIQYLLAYRLKVAVSLLKETRMPVSEISIRCGFENPNYFTRVFKMKYRVTPTQFRTTGEGPMVNVSET
ncbi:MAG TPA: hypothetical protein DD727_06120 [Clostridiales bacterium]|nr:hypothetical protein [Clostridiales bacterium]